MELPSTLKIKLSEKALKKITGTPDELVLPVDSKGMTFSGLSSAIQLVMTWARNSNTRTLIVKKSVSDSVEEALEKVIERPHYFVAAMFAKSVYLISGNERIDVRSKINLMAKEAVERQHVSRFGQNRGALCWSIFVDHSSKAFDPRFYITKSEKIAEPRSTDQIRTIISKMLEKSSAMSGGAVIPNSEEIKYLGRVFYELFLNTHEHGSRNVKRLEWLSPGVRVLYSNGISLIKEAAISLIKNEPVLASYLNYDKEKYRFLEIGIIDSGLGFFERWIADHPEDEFDKDNLQQEYKIFKKCLSFRISSVRADEKGNGLPVVMERLSKLNGFMRIRSGRLSLYRDFRTNPFFANERGNVEFFDWGKQKNGFEILTDNTKISGVAITLLIPLEDKENVEDSQ